MRSRWDALPDDVVALVLRHRAATTLQTAWRATTVRHARHPAWPRVRAHLRGIGAWPALAPYAQVRREWRTEPESWLRTNERVARAIRDEAAAGMWGPAADRLASILSPSER
jgi:hypothetical protein